MYIYGDVGFRPIEAEDLEAMRELRNDPSTWAALTSAGMISRADQEGWFASLQKAKDKAYFACFEVESTYPVIAQGDFIGIIRCDEMDGLNRSVRIGADVIPEKRGQGWGTKIYHALLRFCFAEWNMNRVGLWVLEDNEIAIRLYKGVGFREDGLIRQAVYRDGRYKDYIVMSLLHDEYREYCRNGLYDIKTPDTKYVPGA